MWEETDLQGNFFIHQKAFWVEHFPQIDVCFGKHCSGVLLVLAELWENPRIFAQLYFVELSSNSIRFVLILDF